ncbi:MAG: YbaY family lipoprotein [Acidobacteria bacterium]|nr:YbaY family lipoprotein [Acidobacteriota bacterium]
MRNRFLIIALTIVFTSVAAFGQASWLDRPLTTNWNRTATVPTAPRATGDQPIIARCRSQIRPATSVVDRAVTAKGWDLFGPAYVYGNVTIITGMASVDGMCRPVQYNGFVFVGNRFAGTLAPNPTDSRTDGAIGRISLFSPDEITVEFARYSENDALCCPSRTSVVSYELTSGIRGVLRATDVSTSDNCRDDGGITTQDNVITGTVTYRQRMALPPNAVLTVKLLDVSRADASSITIAEQRIETAGKQVPIPFDLVYEQRRINERNRYAVRAEIHDGDRLLFTTDTSHPVLTQGNPRNADITLVAVGGRGQTGQNRDSVIRGNVTYRQRIALERNSEVLVKLVDAADVDGEPLAETTVNTGNRQVPIAFQLDYDRRDIRQGRSYELRAEIRSGGRLRFNTPEGHRVSFAGNAAQNVELVLAPAQDGPTAITGHTLNLSKFGIGSIQIDTRTDVVVSGRVTVSDDGNASVALTRHNGTVMFDGKLTSYDNGILKITIGNSGDADASGVIEVRYSGSRLNSLTTSDLVLDGQKVTLRF